MRHLTISVLLVMLGGTPVLSQQATTTLLDTASASKTQQALDALNTEVAKLKVEIAALEQKIVAGVTATDALKVQLQGQVDAMIVRLAKLEDANALPQNCVQTAWVLESFEPWDTCVGGRQTRDEVWARKTTTEAANGGTACGPLSETRSGTQACSTFPPLDCQGTWSSWAITTCQACAGGSQTCTEQRTFAITQHPSNGGAACPASPESRTVQQSCTAPPPSSASVTVVTAGPFTAGMALPAGVSSTGLRVGSLPTQTDVKTRWPDGSIRHVILSATAPSAGTLAVSAGAASTGSFTPTWPQVRVTLGTSNVNLPVFSSADCWLNGPYVRDCRVRLPAHRSLEVVFDVRSYVWGAHRVDITVQNIKNLATTIRESYTASITIDGSQVMAPTSLSHAAMMRWRKVFSVGTIGKARPGVASFQASKAIPRYVPTTTSIAAYNLQEPWYGLLKPGCSPANMNQAGGRTDLAPYPEFVAVYAIEGRADAYDLTLLCGDHAGHWSAHLTEADGSMVTIDTHPNLWFHTNPADTGGLEPLTVPHRHVGGCDSCWEWPQVPENAHVPSISLIPYLMTGDRYHADELMHWANFGLLLEHPPSRGGALGRINGQMRGRAWAFRNLVDAAVWLPDAHPYKSYFTTKVQNNLTHFDAIAKGATGPLGSWGEQGEDPWGVGGLAVMAPWQNGYQAWASNHARRQGFTTAGLGLLDKAARFQLNLYTWNPGESGAYYLPFNDSTGWFSSYTTMRSKFLQYSGNNTGELKAITAYALDVRLALLVAEQRGMTGATAALNWLEAQSYASLSVMQARPAYAISREGMQ